MMGTVIIVLLIIIDVFNIGYMQLCKEPTWKTSITVKSNSRIGEIIFKIPDNDGKGKKQTDIQLCYTSNYFEMVNRNQREIRVRSCLPDDYTEVLPLCTENDGTCHGTLNITVIPFWHRRFRPMNIIVMVTDKPKADIIGITTSRAFGECTRFQPGCSISSTNSYKLFWFSSGSMHPCHTEKTGNHHAFTTTRGINYGFPYRLKVTCPKRGDIKIVSWSPNQSFFVRIMFIQKRISHVTPENVSPRTQLQIAANIHNRDLIKFATRSTDVIFRVTSMGSSTGINPLTKRLKRACNIGKVSPPHREKRGCGYVITTPMIAMTIFSSLISLTNRNTVPLTTSTATTRIPSTLLMTSRKTQTTPSTTLAATSTTEWTARKMPYITPSTTGTTTSTTSSTTHRTTNTTPLITQVVTSTTSSTTGITSTAHSITQSTATTSTVSSTTLKTTSISPLSMSPSTTRTTPGNTLSNAIDTSTTRLTTITSTRQSTKPSTTISTLSTMLFTRQITSLATSSIRHLNVQTSTSTNSQKISSSIQLTTKLNTEPTKTLCTACISTPSPSAPTKPHQNSLKTLPVTTPTPQQTTTTCKSPKASKMATDSSMLGASVSSSMKEITPMHDTTTNFTTSTVSTVFSNTTKHPSTDSFGSLKANTSILASMALSIASAPRELTTTSTSTAGTSPTETTLAPMDPAIALPNAEQRSSNAFIDDPLNVALVSILAGFTAIGSTVWIISVIRSKIAQTGNNRFDSTVHESTSTSSSASSISEDNIRHGGSSLSPNNMFSSTASNISLLTPVETV